MNIAFIGLGNMGEGMARQLLRAGHRLTVYNRTRAKTAALEREGAAVAVTPAAAVERADAAFTMLSDDGALRAVVFGDDGLAAALPRSAVHVGSSTISVALSKELAQAHDERGQSYVAAPVLGRPEAAASKRLWIMAAGKPEALRRVRPLLEVLGRGVSVMGDEPWQANLTKIAANFLISAMLEALAESSALVRKSGLDEQAFLQVVDALFASPVYASYGRILAERRFEPAGFRLELGLKDTTLALSSAHETAVPMPLAALVHDHYLSAVAHGRGNADWAALSEVVARNAGLDT